MTTDLHVVGITAQSKVYDGTTDATVDFSGAHFQEDIGTAAVALDVAAPAGTFADATAGAGKTINITGLSLTGGDAGNYNLVIAVTANIDPKPITMNNVAVTAKVYDATDAATLDFSAATLVGLIAGHDAVGFAGGTGTYNDKTVGTGKAVTITGVTLTLADKDNYTLTQPSATGDITAKNLNVSGITANKTYDGTAAATLNTSAYAFDAVQGADTVVLSATGATAAFDDALAANGKNVTVSGLALSGADAGNYTLTQPALTADIAKKNLTITGVSVANKPYDQGTTATANFTSATLVGVVGSDDVSINSSAATASFATATAATGKSVTIVGVTLDGTAAGNYTVTQPSTTADITPVALTISGVGISNKTYDGNATATMSLVGATLNGVLAGDELDVTPAGGSAAFSSKTVATGKTVTISGITLAGAKAANYTLAQPTGLTADITARTLNVSGITANKVYDRANTATLNVSGATFDAVVGGDAVALSTSGATANFADALVGVGKAVTVSGLALVGNDAANYSLVQPAVTAAITPVTVNATGITAATRAYDATTTVTLALGSAGLSGVLTGDTVTLTTAGATGSAASKNVGTQSVTITGLSLGGADAANYLLGSATTNVVITPAALTVAGATATTREYNATTTATVSLAGATLNGVIGAEDVSLNSSAATGAFATKAVGTGKTVTISGLTLNGADKNNYSITPPTATADITAKALTVAGVTSSKVYDGTTAAPLTFTSATFGGIVAGDTVTINSSAASGTFADKIPGTGKTITITGIAAAGADAANYTVTQPSITGTISVKPLTVTGVVATGHPFDGNTAVQLSFASAQLNGVVAGDTVTLVTAGVTASVVSPFAGVRNVTITGLSITGASVSNYSLVIPSLQAEITKGPATIVLSGLDRTYTGSPVAVTATSTPGALTLVYSYAGSASAPTNAGTYAVTVSVDNANWTGSASGTLTIAKAAQTITFASPGAPTIGKALALGATASSGLPVSYSVVSGNATISGSSITVTDAGTVVVEASQAGDSNYNAAPKVSVTLGGGSKAAQTITFAALANKSVTDAAFTLNATASSGLPVSFSVVSGPATISGSTVTLAGAPGAVTIRASQAGNASFAAAPDVTQSFTVTASSPSIYFGSLTAGTALELLANDPNGVALAADDSFAAQVAADGRSGTMLGYISARKEAFVVSFQPDASGNFVATATTTVVGGAGVSRTFRGTVSGGVLTGSIDGLGLNFAASVQAPSGSLSSLAGYYAAPALGSAGSGTYTMIAANGRAYVLAIAPTAVESQSTTVTSDGKFSVTGAGNTVIAGTIDTKTAAVAATITPAGEAPILCQGVSSNVVRTDRLVNLSSRAVVGSASRMLISGFVVSGSSPKPVLVRAVGPGLTAFGLKGVADAPVLTIYNGATVVATNKGWSTASNAADIATTAARVGAFTLASGSADSAILVTLQPGTYTAQVTNASGDAVALAEIYDASTTPGTEVQRLVNVSSRGVSGTGENVLIGGFVVTGNAPKTVLVRGVGPGLAAFGVDSLLADPVVSVFQGQTQIGSNDDWSSDAKVATQLSDAAKQVGAFALTSGGKDAAVLLTLAPGSYTAQVSGKAGATGVALVEIYEVP